MLVPHLQTLTFSCPHVLMSDICPCLSASTPILLRLLQSTLACGMLAALPELASQIASECNRPLLLTGYSQAQPLNEKRKHFGWIPNSK
jgi:hypothetical protein